MMLGWSIRDGTRADSAELARLAIMAGHGLLDVFYRDLIPGMSTEDIVAQRRMTWPGSWAAAERWRIAVSADGRTLGGLNAFPHDVLSNAQPDPLMGPERRDAAAALGRLEEEQTPGSFYINMIAVFPERRSGGVGSVLMAEAERLARAAGFGRMTLSTFAADHKLVSFYRRHGFEIVATAPIAPHPWLEHGGDWAVMARDLQP